MIALKNPNAKIDLADTLTTRPLLQSEERSERVLVRPDFSQLGKMELTNGHRVLLAVVQLYIVLMFCLLGYHVFTLIR